MANLKKPRHLSDQEIELLGLQPVTKKLPENPIAVDEMVLLSGGDLENLDAWVVDELIARSAENVAKALKKVPSSEECASNPDISLLADLLRSTKHRKRRSPKGNAASFFQYVKRKYTVAAVLAARRLGVKGDTAFDVASTYLKSVGIGMSPGIVRKNFFKWKGGATPHVTFMSLWEGELFMFAKPYVTVPEERKKR